MEENPVYSKMEYGEAVIAKKLILSAEMDLLNCESIIDSYRELRKQELMQKIKLKNTLVEIKAHIAKIIDNSPKTEGIKKVMNIKHISMSGDHEARKKKDISGQLLNIRERLNALAG